VTCGVTNFNDFPDNQLHKFLVFIGSSRAYVNCIYCSIIVVVVIRYYLSHNKTLLVYVESLCFVTVG